MGGSTAPAKSTPAGGCTKAYSYFATILSENGSSIALKPSTSGQSWCNRPRYTLGVKPRRVSFSKTKAKCVGDETVAVDVTTSSIPELSSWAMMLIGFAGLGFAGYRAKRQRRGLNGVFTAY